MNNTNYNVLDRNERVTDLLTLRQLLSNRHAFRVPDYQRGYAWASEFCVMWQDILRLHQTINSKHYTGMLALEEIKDESITVNEAVTGTTAFYIVDGQQRITSLVIIVQSLLGYIQDELPQLDMTEYKDLLVIDDVIYRFGYSYKRQDGAAQYFEERVFKNNTGLPHSDKYLSNINSAKDFVDHELNRVTGDTAKAILDTILDRIVFNIYFVTDDFDVRVTFETINNRGKKLSNLELLKNRLMYLTTFFPSGDARGDQLKIKINSAWQEIYSKLCFGEEQLSDDDYLKAHWIVYGSLNKRKSNAYIESLLGEEFAIDNGVFYKLITNKEYSLAYNHIKEYIESLARYVLYWAFVNKPEDVSINLPADEITHIKRLSRISSTLYLRSALMVVAGQLDLPAADKSVYYSKVELFIFTNKLLAQDNNDLSFLVTSAKKLLNSPNSKTKVFTEIIEDIDQHDLHVDAKRVITAVDAFRLNVLEKKSEYYFSWNGLSYLLYEYNESLNIPNAESVQWYKLKNTSIEHVLPQTPTSEYWLTAFGNYSEDERKRITNSLGNLLLLSSGSENSSLQNYSFPVKKDMSVDSKRFAYSYGSRSAREIASNDHWTINEINNRTDKIISFIYDNWFAGLGISEQDWSKCAMVLKNSVPDSLSDRDHSDLISKLSVIDTSGERKAADKSATTKKTNYLHEQFLSYIDTRSMPTGYNANRIYYKDWFCFKIVTANDSPVRFVAGVDVNGVSYRVRYFYDTNIAEVNYWNNQNEEVYLNNIDELPDKLRPFVLALFRYLRKSFNKERPTWIINSN